MNQEFDARFKDHGKRRENRVLEERKSEREKRKKEREKKEKENEMEKGRTRHVYV